MISRRQAFGLTALTLVGSAVLQLAVYRNGGHDALGDIPGRFFAWRLRPDALPYLDRPVEYPAVIGAVGYLTALVGRTATSFFALTALMSAGLAFFMTRLLHSHAPDRILRWAAGLPVLLYAFHNWDLFAMVPAVLGILAYRRGADRCAGAWLGLGFSTKLFPGLMLAPLVVARWCEGDRRGARRLAASGIGVTLAVNAPVALASWSGWSFPARFQGARRATWGSLISWITSPPWDVPQITEFADPASTANIIAFVLLGLGLAAVTVLGVRRRLDAAAIGVAAVAVFLLSNKVYSPNYDFWLVPFFVLVPFARRQWVAFCAADLGMFVVVFGRFHGLVEPSVAGNLVPVFTFSRAVILVWLIATALGGGSRGAKSPSRMSGTPKRGVSKSESSRSFAERGPSGLRRSRMSGNLVQRAPRMS